MTGCRGCLRPKTNTRLWFLNWRKRNLARTSSKRIWRISSRGERKSRMRSWPLKCESDRSLYKRTCLGLCRPKVRFEDCLSLDRQERLVYIYICKCLMMTFQSRYAFLSVSLLDSARLLTPHSFGPAPNCPPFPLTRLTICLSVCMAGWLTD